MWHLKLLAMVLTVISLMNIHPYLVDADSDDFLEKTRCYLKAGEDIDTKIICLKNNLDSMRMIKSLDQNCNAETNECLMIRTCVSKWAPDFDLAEKCISRNENNIKKGRGVGFILPYNPDPGIKTTDFIITRSALEWLENDGFYITGDILNAGKVPAGVRLHARLSKGKNKLLIEKDWWPCGVDNILPKDKCTFRKKLTNKKILTGYELIITGYEHW